MTQHTHTERVAGCYRCELGRDEAESAMQFEIEDLEADNARLRAFLERIEANAGEPHSADLAEQALYTDLRPPHDRQ